MMRMQQMFNTYTSVFILSGSLISSSVFAQDAENTQIDFEALKGQVVYLDFWASWCGPCKASFPWMEKMHRRYRQQGLKIIAVNLDQEQQLAKDFLKENTASFDIVFDKQGTLAQAFNVETMPTSYLINRSGEAKIKHSGFHSHDQAKYEREIKRLLGESGDE